VNPKNGKWLLIPNLDDGGIEGIFVLISHNIQPRERQCRLVDGALIGVNDKRIGPP